MYEVGWTRLLTLRIGHTTGAASAVVAAFLGGLAAGAAVASAGVHRLPARRALHLYIALEVFVAAAAAVLPLALDAMTPLLVWAYGDAASPQLYATVRLAICLALVFVPSAALGATFPTAASWFVRDAPDG